MNSTVYWMHLPSNFQTKWSRSLLDCFCQSRLGFNVNVQGKGGLKFKIFWTGLSLSSLWMSNFLPKNLYAGAYGPRRLRCTRGQFPHLPAPQGPSKSSNWVNIVEIDQKRSVQTTFLICISLISWPKDKKDVKKGRWWGNLELQVPFGINLNWHLTAKKLYF